MKSLIVGGNSFIGRHLYDYLKILGGGVFRTHCSSSHTSDSIYLNILNKSSIGEVLIATQPDCIYHLSGVSNPKEARNNKQSTIYINIDGTSNLLAMVHRFCPKAKVLFLSSGKVYAKAYTGYSISETSPVAPNEIYGYSKIAAESIYQCYSNLGLKVVIARAFNQFGPGQRKGFVIPDFIDKIRNGEKIATCDNIVNLCDVRDSVRAYALMMLSNCSGIYNVASSAHYNLSTIAQQIGEEMGKSVEFSAQGSEFQGFVNIDKICTLGWKPSIPLRSTLRYLVNNG